MKFHAFLLLAAVLASPAGSQETPTFDLKSESIRNIVRTTAATQFGMAKLVEDRAPESKATKTVRFVPAEKPVSKERPRPASQPMPEPRDGFVSAFLSTLIDYEMDRLLGDGGQVWARCKSGVPEAQARVTAVCEQ